MTWTLTRIINGLKNTICICEEEKEVTIVYVTLYYAILRRFVTTFRQCEFVFVRQFILHAKRLEFRIVRL